MNLGYCPYCGGPIVEKEDRYECEYNDGGNHGVIWKNALENHGGMPLDARDAKTLFQGGLIYVQLKSKKTGRFYYAYARYNDETTKIEIHIKKRR